ncbi:CD276 antigen homolog isoform X2 [Pangasianodon hypophthalmus]|uniref:CD276 antigen homolog isoform X2 n=1 Tax=Pangasianodon hypophthalmus TaxID=310915 RepID=UPI0023083654|nr:CD276 antigen homolog isoform X2 [Pangasianodon hypophthalmus]
MNELGMSWFFSFTFLLLIHKVSVQSVPVEGIIGQTVILPCKLKQKPQTVFWRYRDDRTVCDFLGGEADFDEQDPAYKDRVEIFPSEIEKGNFSIMLSNVKKSDEGTYTCIATNLTPLTVELTVKVSCRLQSCCFGANQKTEKRNKPQQREKRSESHHRVLPHQTANPRDEQTVC